MQIEKLSHLLDKAAQAYYDGKPIMPDDVFDKLEQYINYTKVGYQSQSRDVKPHFFRMYSLQKYYKEDGKPPFQSNTDLEVVCTPKLDGAAVSHLYIDGQYSMSLRRGDGVTGEDITAKFIDGKLIPLVLASNEEILQVTGEVVSPKTIPNARNYASGALGLDSIEEFNSRKVQFIAYDVQATKTLFPTYCENMAWLHTQGFATVINSNWEEYDQDGLVFRYDNNTKYFGSGFTSKHPKGAYALKNKAPGIVTELLDVVWETGKTGKVTPVAIIKPVIINGATISRVTLNNPGFIEELNLDIGDLVEIVRAGDIIPKLVGKVEL